MSGPANKWVVTASIAVGSLMATIDASIVNVAVPILRGELGASIEQITWVSTAYLIAMVLVMPMTGFLGAMFGQKRVFLASLALFVVGSALCGMARSLPALVLFRTIQGLGGGALQPTQQAILRQTFPPSEQGMAMAVFSMVVMIGPAIGPVLGGWITDQYAWPWIFYINVPVGALAIFLAGRNVHEPEDVRATNRARAQLQRRNLDWAGIALMVVAVGALQVLFEEGPQKNWFESDLVVAAAYLAIFGLAAFVIRELTATAPVVNLRLFRDPTFAAASIIGTAMFAMLMGSMFLLPVFLEELLGLPATDAGLALLPRTLAMMLVSPIIGRVYNRVGPAALVGVGVLLFAIGSWQLSTIGAGTSVGQMIVPLAVTGASFAFLFVPLTTAALSTTPRALLADAAGLNSFVRQIGGSIGLTIIASRFAATTATARAALSDQVSALRPELAAPPPLGHAAAQVARDAAVIGFDRAFLAQAAALLLVVPLLWFLRRRPVAQAPAPPPDLHLAIE